MFPSLENFSINTKPNSEFLIQQFMASKKIDKYIILLNERLGKGAFADVYKGKLADGTGEYAIKVIDKKIFKHDEYLKNALFNQITIMKKVKSEYIVRLQEVLQTGNNYYIIQQFCKDGQLKSFMRNKGRCSEAQATAIVVMILKGFVLLVKSGVIHRDLKPDNLLINNGIIKIADFGFAKVLHNYKAQMLNSMVGTPLYMSPQILRDQKYSSKSDIWSIGLIFYQLLHGRHPFKASSEAELLKKIQHTKPQYDSSLSPLCLDFLQRCLIVNQSQRLSWDQVFRHQLFRGEFKEYLEQQKKLQDRAQYIINNLRMKVHQNNLDLENLFKKIDSSKDGAISRGQLGKLLYTIDRTITRDQLKHIFQKFDKDGNGSIDFQQFRDWMKNNDIRMSALKGLPTSETPQQKNASNSIAKIKTSIQKLDIDLHDIFHKFGKKGKQQLDLTQFKNMLSVIDKSLTQGQVCLAFKQFDVNGDKKITFEQFRNLLFKITGVADISPQALKQLENAIKEI